MRKAIIIVLIAFTLVGCQYRTSGNNPAIPTRFKTLEFWNGGACIASYENVEMAIEIATTERVTGNIRYHLYHVLEANGKVTTIMDSEALAIKWTE
jgi:hypothetical protein